jgi:hypothetical protein
VASLENPNQTKETLTIINEDILKIANQASLKILVDDKAVDIRHKFRLGDKSTLGVLFFLFGGAFFILIPFIKTSTESSKYIGPFIGVGILVLSILSLIRQVVDGIQIKDNILTIRHYLKQTTFPLNSSIKIKMKIELMKIRRSGTKGSDFIIVKHFLQDQNKEIPILSFQMDNANAKNAKKLGNELTRIINAKFRQ